MVKRSAEKSKKAYLLIVCLFSAVMVVIVIALALLVIRGPLRQSELAALPTVAIIPTATQPPPTTPPTVLPSVTPDQRGTLPATWTAQPSPTAVNTLDATRQPTPSMQNTVYPTLAPEALMNTYWEGDGERTMWDRQLGGNTFGRYDIFPVNLNIAPYRDMVITDAHETAITQAIYEMNRVVPVQRVELSPYAHIKVWIMSDADFRANAACGEMHDTVAACAVPYYTSGGYLLSVVWIDGDDACFMQTLLHELTHALGVRVHSPDPDDIMYYNQTCTQTTYTQRDINTLRALYDAPVYHPPHNTDLTVDLGWDTPTPIATTLP